MATSSCKWEGKWGSECKSSSCNDDTTVSFNNICKLLLLLLDSNDFITHFFRSCFLDWNEPLLFGFLPFLLLMFSFNAICYVLIVQRLICSKQMGSSKSSWNIAWQRVLNSMAIATLLGMSWGFGFISLAFVGDGSDESLNLFDILFCVTLSLKGFLVFLLFGVRNKEFREPWRRIYVRVFRKGKQSAQINFPISVNYSDEKATNFMGHTVVPSQRTFSTAATSLEKVWSLTRWILGIWKYYGFEKFPILHGHDLEVSQWHFWSWPWL